MSDGFLGRWSKRKLEVKERAVEAQPEVQVGLAVPAMPPPQPSPVKGGSEDEDQGALPPPPLGEGGDGGNAGQPPPLTLDDVKLLTAESDFTRFAARDVSPEVKNAAMKRLFSDPRYNIQDGLDTYIGDYSQPDPIPEAMLRKLVSAKFLGLFDQEEKAEALEAERQARDVADNPSPQSVAQSEPVQAPEVPEVPEHADPDLRLQQDHAAPGEDPGRGTG